ncbi:rRNA small subunit methyltransferase, glucose inhibited division protein GidB [Roseibacterium elongatum DSM 19469]|uniref:Ribosomal RNA small subunit methyltransferase G n=1 Tax=Roseicyclus elongatus DSM 19469 TaxID=1294273 RepID=W8RQX3_9RHOB|nr:16S rRNA (guanine(527)-N(7))-methyltransferase RsmG [Roseibacterium elongatum]AHM03453.1 rRNA small subunit methyltransferase, glucose inhibited division protein GidB [Roseibacterium elongatum DSM 19469]
MTEDAARARLFSGVSRETSEKLIAYHTALLKWQKAINLISPSTLGTAWERHFLDSAQVFEAATKTEGKWLDLGSGGGFPGMVCAILASEKAPQLSFTFIESDIRKCSFLREVGRQVGASVNVLSRRIEDAPPQRADVISARALVNLDQLLGYAHRHLAPDGECLFQKGAAYREELASAQANWQTDADCIPSTTAADAAILRIGNISHV